MQFFVTQDSRPNLSGPAFLDFLTQFPNEPIAVLHSGHLQGFSVIARRPLVTLVAPDEHSPAIVHTARHFPAKEIYENLQQKIVQNWEYVLKTPRLDFPVNPLTAWIGHISYEIGRVFENIGVQATDDLHCPLLYWQLFEEYFLFDHAQQTWTLVLTSWYGRKDTQKMLDEMHQRLTSPFQLPPPSSSESATLLDSMQRDVYLQKVGRIKDYITTGDIFQANFAQRWSAATTAKPIDIFRRLMIESPSPYAALIITDPAHGPLRATISASPELLLHRHGRDLMTRPIKGTRPRDLSDSTHDQQLHDELLHSEKDQAELAMIVDLLRNDLGRLADYGSVKVQIPREIEQLPTLWHAVATINAKLFRTSGELGHYESPPAPEPRLDVGRSWSAIARALLPGGSVTGAPKIRAMQIIEELEPTRRGLYCGTIGCISTDPEEKSSDCFHLHPTATFNIAIRTIQLINNTAYIHAGSGIVADSDPSKEYEECLHKAAALFRALNLKI